MVELADIVRWTPVNLNLLPTPSIDWADLTGQRFDDPFFDQTVTRALDRDGATGLVRTDLDTLLALDDEPSVEPAGLIFHLSRCGSTLLSRQLGLVAGTVAISEPGPLNTLIQAAPSLVDEAIQVRVLRLLVRAFGRVRFGDERRTVLKLSSWNIRRLDLVRRAFPGVPLVWLQRRPEAVLASTLASEPGWLSLRHLPSQAVELFGLAPEAPVGTDAAGFAVRALKALLEAAAAAEDVSVVDYDELPQAAWQRVARLFGMPVDAADRAAMAAVASFHAKSDGGVPFDRAADHARLLPPEIQSLVAAELDPLYHRLDRRRRAQLDLMPCSR